MSACLYFLKRIVNCGEKNVFIITKWIAKKIYRQTREKIEHAKSTSLSILVVGVLLDLGRQVKLEIAVVLDAKLDDDRHFCGHGDASARREYSRLRELAEVFDGEAELRLLGARDADAALIASLLFVLVGDAALRVLRRLVRDFVAAIFAERLECNLQERRHERCLDSKRLDCALGL